MGSGKNINLSVFSTPYSQFPTPKPVNQLFTIFILMAHFHTKPPKKSSFMKVLAIALIFFGYSAAGQGDLRFSFGGKPFEAKKSSAPERKETKTKETKAKETKVKKEVKAKKEIKAKEVVRKEEPNAKEEEVAQKDFAQSDRRDGKTYKTVKIGSQTWMAENLNYNASDSKCYDNDESNCQKYGRLYDWNAAMKACPSGWHLPTQAEWEVMTAYIGGERTEGKKLKATSGWNDYQGKSGNGTDEFDFSALPGGGSYSNGSFISAGYYGYWWSAGEGNSNGAYIRYMNYNYEAIWRNINKSYLFSVRCLRD